MVFKNTPPGEQRVYSLPATRPLYANTQGFNTNSFVIRQSNIQPQLSSSSGLVRRSNVTQQSTSKKFSQ